MSTVIEYLYYEALKELEATFFLTGIRAKHGFQSHFSIFSAGSCLGTGTLIPGDEDMTSQPNELSRDAWQMFTVLMMVSGNGGPPKSSILAGVFHYKSSIWGHLYLWKPP